MKLKQISFNDAVKRNGEMILRIKATALIKAKVVREPDQDQDGAVAVRIVEILEQFTPSRLRLTGDILLVGPEAQFFACEEEKRK